MALSNPEILIKEPISQEWRRRWINRKALELDQLGDPINLLPGESVVKTREGDIITYMHGSGFTQTWNSDGTKVRIDINDPVKGGDDRHPYSDVI